MSHLASLLLGRLVWTSLQSTALVVLVAGALRAMPGLPLTLRCTLWWMICIQAIGGLCWQFRVPLLVGHAQAMVSTVESGSVLVRQQVAHAVIATPHPGWTVDWPEVLVLIWLSGLTIQMLRLARSWREMRVLIHDAVPVTDPAWHARNHALSLRWRLRMPPALLISDRVAAPLVTGFRRPTIILPSNLSLTESGLTLVLAHELAHVRRCDLWLGLVPALAQRLFFFHPLLRWTARAYASDRESACDAMVLDIADIVPWHYGTLLLRLGVGPRVQHGIGSSSETFRMLQRRLAGLKDMHRHRPASFALRAVTVLLMVATGLPYRVMAQQPGLELARAAKTHDQPGPRDAYALIIDRPGSGHDSDVHTQTHDLRDAQTVSELAQRHQSFFWFRKDAKTYLIEDPAYIARASAMMTPIEAFWQDAGRVNAREWSVRGPLIGVDAQLRSIEGQRRDLQEHPDAPAQAVRLASLEDQERDLRSQEVQLKQRLAHLQPLLADHERQAGLVEAETMSRSWALVQDALAHHAAQHQAADIADR